MDTTSTSGHPIPAPAKPSPVSTTPAAASDLATELAAWLIAVALGAAAADEHERDVAA
jgi:hypothetical protein